MQVVPAVLGRGMDVSDYSVVENMTEALWHLCSVRGVSFFARNQRGSMFPSPDATSSAFNSAQCVELLEAFEPYYKLWTSAIDFKHSEASGFLWILSIHIISSYMYLHMNSICIYICNIPHCFAEKTSALSR